MGSTCSTHGEKCVRGFVGGNLREGDHLKEIGIEGRTVLIATLRTGWECVDWVTGQVACTGQNGNEPSGPIKTWRFLGLAEKKLGS